MYLQDGFCVLLYYLGQAHLGSVYFYFSLSWWWKTQLNAEIALKKTLRQVSYLVSGLNTKMYGAEAIELLKELRRAAPHLVPPYNVREQMHHLRPP